MKKYQYIGALALLLNVACIKQQDPSFNVLMTYQMTQCSDPWMRNGFGNDKESELKNFLMHNQINVIYLNIIQNEQLTVCDACHCASNYTAIVKVPLEQVAAMEKFKFKRQ
jgi:hypothetical protein